MAICDDNPFTTEIAQNLVRNVSLDRMDINLSKADYVSSFFNTPIGTELTKMLGASPLYIEH